MPRDLIINCPNTCKNNCPACYLKTLKMNSYVSDYAEFCSNLLAEVKYGSNEPYDNIHLFSANGDREWNMAMASVCKELELKNKIKNDVYLYFKYDDLESMKQMARSIWSLRGGSITEVKPTFRKFQLAFSIIDPYKQHDVYVDAIDKMSKLFLGYCDNRFAGNDIHAGCLLTYTFTNDYILALNAERLEVLQNNISQHVFSLRTMGFNEVAVAITIAKPFSSDPIEAKHAFNFLTSTFKYLSSTFVKNGVDTALVMDYCFMNYMNAKFLTTEGKASIIGVYDECDIYTPQGTAFIKNKCPYTTLDIRACDKCPIKEGITNG